MNTIRELSPKQTKLIGYLLAEKTIDEACQKAKIGVATYWRWMQDEAFLLEYRAARRVILENTISRLQSVTYRAIETLERNLNCNNPSAEIHAAQTILEQSLKGLEILDLERRLAEIERGICKSEREKYE